MNLWQTLGKRIVLFDGGLGTLLQSKGLKAGESPALWTLSHPDVLLEIHCQYLEAGCDVVTTNTFGANRLMLPPSVSVSDAVGKAVALAKDATRKAGRGAVALDIGPTGRLLAPYGNLPFEEAVSVFGEMVRAGAEAGADFILMETMSDSYEIKAAVLAAKENSSLPIMVTMMFGGQGKLLTGADVRGMVAMLESLGVSALGCNCGFGPSQLKGIAAQLLAEASVPVIVNPNAGLPEVVDGQTRYLLEPEEFAAKTAEI
nr:homocysteine S-methyltransferase family protein [Clostridia bacterium]